MRAALVATAAGFDLESRISGRSAAIRRVRSRVLALAPLRVPVLITGEPGTGHDCVARALHAAGSLADAPFLPVRCGETDRLPDRMAGAVVYLDRVEHLAPADQARWLRALDDRPGPRGPCRVLASTCEDLAHLCERGAFQRELAERLARFSVRLPALRERPGDFARLVPALVARAGAELGRSDCRVSAAALARLRARSWPGNVGELARVVERLVAFAADGEISAELVNEVLGELPAGVSSLRAREDRRQREELVRLLGECGGNLAEVARRLGLSRGAVIHRARKFGLIPGPRRAASR